MIFLLAFSFKSDSTFGRLLIYKISWKIFSENLGGIGAGNFSVKYGLYQANYFQAGSFTKKEFLLADNVFFAFNDYWQFIIERGIFGAFLLFSFMLLIIVMIKRKLNQHLISHFSRLIILLFFVVCSAACFTHVFEKRILLIFAGTVVFWIFITDSVVGIKAVYERILIVVFILGFSISQYFTDIVNFKNYKKLSHAKELSSASYVLESQKLYEEIYPSMENDIDFLKAYCNDMKEQDDRKRTLFVYEHLLELRTDYRLYFEYAKICEHLNLEDKAEKFYLRAMYMVPNRFLTRLELFNFYIKNRQFNKAKKLGEFTVNMPIKVPSVKIDEIRIEMKRKMNLL